MVLSTNQFLERFNWPLGSNMTKISTAHLNWRYKYFWFRSCEFYFLWGNLRWLLPSEVGRGDWQTHVDLCCGLELLELEGGCQTIWRRWKILSLSWIMRGTGLTKDWNCFSSNWQTWIGNDWIEGPGSKRLDGIECLQKIVMRRGGPQFCWHFWYYNWCKWLITVMNHFFVLFASSDRWFKFMVLLCSNFYFFVYLTCLSSMS